jgi:hypothetical protein
MYLSRLLLKISSALNQKKKTVKLGNFVGQVHNTTNTQIPRRKRAKIIHPPKPRFSCRPQARKHHGLAGGRQKM